MFDRNAVNSKMKSGLTLWQIIRLLLKKYASVLRMVISTCLLIQVNPVWAMNDGPVRKIAILVAIEEYNHFAPLHYTVDDMESLAEVLKEQGWDVRTYLDGMRGDKRYPTNQKFPTRDLLVTELRNLELEFNNRPNGTVLFAFSGHGFEEKETNAAYLALKATDDRNIFDTALKVDDVKKLLKASGAKQQIMLMDACRNDPNGQKSGAISVDDFLTPFFTKPLLIEGKGLFVMFATETGKLSAELSSYEFKQGGLNVDKPNEGHGVFTYFLLKGLKGEAANGLGEIRFKDLADYVIKNTAIWSNNNPPNRTYPQRPYVSGESSGDIILATQPSKYLEIRSVLTQIAESLNSASTMAGVVLLGVLLWLLRARRSRGIAPVPAFQSAPHTAAYATNVSSTEVMDVFDADKKWLVSVKAGHPVTFGRLPENQIVINDTGVSGTHARIRWDVVQKAFRLEDLGSTNGTWVIRAGQRDNTPQQVSSEGVSLNNQDIVIIAKSVIRFVVSL